MDIPVTRALTALAVTFVVASAVGGLSATAAAADEPTVSLVPATDAVGVDETTTVDLVVQGATGGVGAYNATVTVDGAAEITAVSVGGDAGLRRVDVADDGSSALVVAALMDTAERTTEPVTVATLTIRGVGDGTSEAAVRVTELVDEGGRIYSVAETTGTSVRVVDATATPAARSPTPTAAPDPGAASTERAATAADVAEPGSAAADANADASTRFDAGLGSDHVAVAVGGVVVLGALFVLGIVVGRRT